MQTVTNCVILGRGKYGYIKWIYFSSLNLACIKKNNNKTIWSCLVILTILSINNIQYKWYTRSPVGVNDAKCSLLYHHHPSVNFLVQLNLLSFLKDVSPTLHKASSVYHHSYILKDSDAFWIAWVYSANRDYFDCNWRYINKAGLNWTVHNIQKISQHNKAEEACN